MRDIPLCCWKEDVPDFLEPLLLRKSVVDEHFPSRGTEGPSRARSELTSLTAKVPM